MTFGSTPFAESTLGGSALAGLAPAAPVNPGPPPVVPPVVTVAPFIVELKGVAMSPRVNSLSIEIESGSQGSATFVLVNASRKPLVGEPVKIKLYTDVLFAGFVDRVNVAIDPAHTLVEYTVECVDHSSLLFRTIVDTTYSDSAISTIAATLLAGELAGNGLSIGVVDIFKNLPIVKAERVSAYDVLKDAAASIGAAFDVDHERKLNFRAATFLPAPMTIDETIVEECRLTDDRETYRNKQTVTVTGTPSAQGIDPAVVTFTTSNAAQIAERASIEGTNGIYNGMEAITHPSANDTVSLTRLAIAYTFILLGVRGGIRQTITVRTRQFGFKVGQQATVSIPSYALSGQWIVQKASYREEYGNRMVTTLELTPSSLKRRAQEMWLEVVQKNKVLVLPPSAVTTNIQVYTTPGTAFFTVPAGVTVVVLRCEGPGGGGGGGAYSSWFFNPPVFVAGGAGGTGGLGISVVAVTPGEILTVTVGSIGTGGTSVQQANVSSTTSGTNGTDATDCTVKRGSTVLCAGVGGFHGLAGSANAFTQVGTTPAGRGSSGGYGDVATVGGGASGGPPGSGSPLINGFNGQPGRITVEW